MPLPSFPQIKSLSHEERAFFCRLAALNVGMEASKAGGIAQRFCHNAQSIEVLLAAFLKVLQTSSISE